MSHHFIERPIFATVISLFITLCGVVAAIPMAVALYPPITPPMVQVSCIYPGASARVVVESVASPIEQVVNGVDNLLYMQSQCTNDGSYQLFLTFAVGSDLNVALVQVQNRIQQAIPSLPREVRLQGVNVTKKSPAVLLAISLVSPNGQYDSVFMSNYATIRLKDELLRLYGVGDVVFLGQRDYSIRGWLDPPHLAARGLNAGQVIDAVADNNRSVACGVVGGEPAGNDAARVTVISASGRLRDPSEFAASVVDAAAGNPEADPVPLIRLGDVGRLELGAQQYGQTATLDGQESVTLAIFQVPGSNALTTAGGIREKMQELATRFPEGLDYRIVYDTTPFIEASIDEVVETLLIAVALVALVVLVFLQNLRATMIPLIAVPVAVLGTFAPMAALGFNINTLSLFGLVLAIGIVVDDAIVVVENVEQWIERGLSPRAAAHRAMDEVTGPIVGVALVLTAVFLPCAFFAGLVGQFYRQFALTIAISTILSAINSLTLSPALAALLLKPRTKPAGRFTLMAVLAPLFGSFNVALDWSTRCYDAGLVRVLRHRLLGIGAYGLLVAGTFWGFAHWRLGFIPIQDQGYLVLNLTLPEGSSVQETARLIKTIDRIARGDPTASEAFPGVAGIAHTVGIAGQSIVYNANAANWGSMFIVLAPFAERTGPDERAEVVLQKLQQACQQVAHRADVTVFPAPPIQGLATGGGFKYYIEDRGGLGDANLDAATQQAIRVSQDSLGDVSTIFNPSSPQVYLDIDREKAQLLGVELDEVFASIQANLGGRYVNNVNRFGRTWQVNLMAAAAYRCDLDHLRDIAVANQAGGMVSLASLVRPRLSSGPNVIMRYNLYTAAPIIMTPPPGIGPSQVLDTTARATADLAPGLTSEWTEIMFLQLAAGTTGPLLFVLGIILVFLVLAALYESWSLPLVVLFVVPLGLLSALVGLVIANTDIDILAQIGLVVLVGLASKNAILIVEFAKVKCESGQPIDEATREASRQRLRPILMTSFAFILGVVPLLTATGAGAEMRHSLGIAVFSGMIGVTMFGLIFTPLFFAMSRHLLRPRQPAAQNDQQP